MFGVIFYRKDMVKAYAIRFNKRVKQNEISLLNIFSQHLPISYLNRISANVLSILFTFTLSNETISVQENRSAFLLVH